MGSVITNSATSTRYARSIEEHARRSRVIAGGVNSNVRLAESPGAAHVRPRRRRAPVGRRRKRVRRLRRRHGSDGPRPQPPARRSPRYGNALEVGQCFAGQNEFEAEFGERLVDAVPWIESIRIGLAGTEMDLLAVRIARAATGPRASAPVRRPLPRLARPAPGRRSDPMPEPFGRPPVGCRAVARRVRRRRHLRVERPRARRAGARAARTVACVIMEPMMCNTGLIAPAPGLPRGVSGPVPTSRRAARDRRGDHRLPARPDRGAGLPRRQRRHHDLRQGGGVRVPDGRARDDARAARAPSGRGEVNHSGTYNAGVLSVAAGVETLRILDRDEPVSRAGQAHGAARRPSSARSGAGKGLAVDHVGGSMLQLRFGSPEPITSRRALVEQLRSGAADSLPRRPAGPRRAADEPRPLLRLRAPTTITSSTCRSNASRRRSPRSDRGAVARARGRQWLSRVTSEPEAPTRKSRSHPRSAWSTWSMYRRAQPRVATGGSGCHVRRRVAQLGVADVEREVATGHVERDRDRRCEPVRADRPPPTPAPRAAPSCRRRCRSCVRR